MSRDPLADNAQFRTDDLDVIRDVGARVLVPHWVDALGPVSSSARMNAAKLGGTTLAYLSYESHIRLEAPTTESTYFLTLPLSGKAEAARGKHEVATCTPKLGVAYRAEDRGVIELGPDYEMLFVRIERHTLERQLQDLLQREVTAPLCFEFSLDLDSPGLRTWADCVSLLRRQMERGDLAERDRLLNARIEDLVMTSLLIGQQHNYSDLLEESRQPARPRSVKLAIDLMEQQPDRPWSVAALARETGVSARTLQEGFQRHVGISPTGYLRETRLRRVHADLVGSVGAETVTELARRWGFEHLGRFAAAYRHKFGELPSETLRRSCPPVTSSR